MKFIKFIFLVAVGSVFLPNLAHAWGGATHLEYASNALGQLILFAPMVKKLLSRYADHFLYGSIAADITIGKNLRGYIYNCHNWLVAHELFENKAKKDHQKAFMLGYMGHLAADTVAHNFFVPFKAIKSWNHKLLKHLYWEMRMDLSVNSDRWKTMEVLAKQNFADDDALLEEHLQKTFFSFRTNKKIFNSLIVLQQYKHYKKMVSAVADQNIWTLAEEEIKNYKSLAQNAVIDFLKNFEKSFVLQADPTGKLKQQYSRYLVKQIKETHLKNPLKPEQEKQLLSHIRAHFREGIYVETDLPGVDYFLKK